ncbi:MAG TPA: SUMF1/EgtB/PvdO family nonheme iron enzyme [Rhodopila sp.]|nr:SUMF1/EgtB/PvdO family nonheme iron enzyme [Rhodopila sp.]
MIHATMHAMIRGRIALLLAGLVMLLPSITAAAPDTERRIALVIGIGAYQNAPHLNNPVNDARAIGDSLRRLKFDVMELYDPGFVALNSGVREFGIRAASADVAVVYYAGHGVQVNRENYLIPADAKLERERDLLYEAMPLDRLLGEVSQASHIGIVLLDSCRNNPFIERVSRSMTLAGRAVGSVPGLARVDNVPRNTMVVMAAKADQIAEDGGDHSPFAAALLAHFQIPGLELSLFFRSVRDTVLRATNNRQEPYAFSSLGAEPFYFYPRPPNRPPEIAAITALQLTEVAGATPLGLPQPIDPDQDPLSVRVIGLPRTGEIRIDGKPVSVNTVVSADRLKTATYKPDGKTIGPAGSFDILIEDGRGGSITASLPITIQSSHRPPVLGRAGRVEVAQQALGIPAPVSPDGDTLSVTVTALPRGTVRNGNAVLRVGDRLTPDELSKLTFWPEAGFVGHAGALRYSVDNGHGGIVEGATEIDVGVAPATGDGSVEAALWNSLLTSNDPAEFAAFLHLFPHSTHAAEAAARQARLLAAAAHDNAARPAGEKPADKPLDQPPPPGSTIVAMSKPRNMPTEPPAPSAATPAAPPAAPPVAVASNRPAAMPPAHPPASGGNTFQDCPSCPVMVRIPPGSFMMGHGSREPESQPAHRVEVRAFALGQFPVTVGEWKQCMAANACHFLPRMRVAEDRTPVHNLSWEDIGQYMAWLSATAGHPYRLPSEAEWEYAARGGTSTRYWWGESVGMALANCSDCGGTQDPYGPLPVDALAPNPFGLYGMLGGVAQWTADCWFPNYRGAPADAAPREAKSCEKRVLRGGSFRAPHDEITVTYRGNYDAAVRYIVNGFRVARDLD